LAALAVQHGVPVHPVHSAFAAAGVTGIGSETTYALRAPKIAVLAGEPTSPSSYGALRFLFEQTYQVDYVPLSVRALRDIRLADFNVIVLPSGHPRHYASALGADGAKKLKAWAEAGGTLVCLGGAAEFAAAEEREWTDARLVKDESKGEGKKRNGETDRPKDETPEEKKAEPEPEKDPIAVPGAILRATLNRDHFLTFGYEAATLPVLVNTAAFYTATETGTNVLTFQGEELRLSGYVWLDNTERLIRDTAALIDEPVGAGRIILFADEPGYRHLWHGTTRMLINAMLYGPGVGHQATSYFKAERE
ncbi:MAG TPA: hypothetical protein VHF69_11290, partial [Candidatus Synoicihabitans sp.]|nr:hypothetical protein [Candidatus Synoicihabitans sp.]